MNAVRMPRPALLSRPATLLTSFTAASGSLRRCSSTATSRLTTPPPPTAGRPGDVTVPSGGEVLGVLQDAGARERLQRPEVERRRADPAARAADAGRLGVGRHAG